MKKITVIIYVFLLTYPPLLLADETTLDENPKHTTAIPGRKNTMVSTKNNNEIYKIKNYLISHLKKSDEIIHLFDIKHGKKKIYIFIIRELSSKKPDGYCGSGHEDYISIINYDAKKINIIDKFLLQSCLENISLYRKNDEINGRDDIAKYISVNNENIIKFFWLTDALISEKELHIEKNHFILKQSFNESYLKEKKHYLKIK